MSTSSETGLHHNIPDPAVMFNSFKPTESRTLAGQGEVETAEDDQILLMQNSHNANLQNTLCVFVAVCVQGQTNYLEL